MPFIASLSWRGVAGARAVRPRRRRVLGRGCDGYAGASRLPKGPAPNRSQETRPGLLEGSSGRAPRDPFGSPGCLAAPASRRFLSRFDLWLPAHPVAGARDHTLRRLAGQRLPAIAGASPLTVVPGLLDLEPSVEPSFQAPIAAT
jgi:hypothetical protein